MATKKEIERKFLVRKLPSCLDDFPSGVITQGYLADTPNLVRLRRINNNVFYLTLKHGPTAIHDECEIRISEGQFNALWPFTAGRRLRKTRYEILYGDYVVDLDIFAGGNDGIVVAEVEFPTEAEARAFIPPDWFGIEVTGDVRYINRRMAVE